MTMVSDLGLFLQPGPGPLTRTTLNLEPRKTWTLKYLDPEKRGL